MVSGLCWFSFCCTSIDRPRTVLVIEIARQCHRFVALLARDFLMLTLDVPLVLGLNFHL